MTEENTKIKLVHLRKKQKSKKPKFIRQDTHKKSKLAKKWKKPRGFHSKIRLAKKGYARKVKKGWKSPKQVRGYTKECLMPIIVSSVKDLKKIKGDQGVIISKTVGNKKKKQLLQEIKKLNLNVLNIKDIDKTIEKIDAKIKTKKEKKKKIIEKKKEKEKEKEKKKEGLTKKIEGEKVQKEEKPKKEGVEDQKLETKKKNKKEFDKLLTKRV